MSEGRKVYQENRDIWTDYKDRQEFEHELINRKTTWWLTGQTILFAAYGVTLREGFPPEAKEFRTTVAATGLAVALVTFIGVAAVIRSKHLSWRSYAKFYSHSKKHHLPYHPPQPLNEKRLQWGVKTNNTWVSLLPDISLPLIFAAAWLYILV